MINIITFIDAHFVYFVQTKINTEMKKLIFLLFAASMLFSSCKEEGCDTTIIPQVRIQVVATVTVLDANQDPLENYPVQVTYQKFWCDGSSTLVFEYSGATYPNGIWTTVSTEFQLSNKEDFILVTLYAGTGTNKLNWSEKIYYEDDFNSSYAFVVN